MQYIILSTTPNACMSTPHSRGYSSFFRFQTVLPIMIISTPNTPPFWGVLLGVVLYPNGFSVPPIWGVVPMSTPHHGGYCTSLH